MRLVKPSGEAERATQTTVDTIEITKKQAAAWKSPPFQRELRPTGKVVCLSEEIKRIGVLPGMLTLGVLDGEVFIVDGQHRLHSFMLTDLPIVYADVRTHYFTSMAAMADEYVKLNSQLVRLRPDDILKGLEEGNERLKTIRRRCAWVGYDAIRRSGRAPLLSMSTVLRVWSGSRPEVPALGGSATAVASQMDEGETTLLVDYLTLCFTAWKRDPEYLALWGSLNLTLCAWLYRRVVVGDAGKGLSRATKLTADQFRRGLTSLSADKEYLEYLVGRRVSERDRAPAYNRLKTIFAQRFFQDEQRKLLLPQPSWAHGSGGR